MLFLPVVPFSVSGWWHRWCGDLEELNECSDVAAVDGFAWFADSLRDLEE